MLFLSIDLLIGVEREECDIALINHLLAAPELTREHNAISRVKHEKIHIY